MTESVQPASLSWPAPAGLLASPEGIQAALEALGFEGTVAREGEAVVFAATRRALWTAALTGAAAGIAAYVLADHFRASPLAAVTGVTLAALVLPPVLVPAYSLSGRVEGGRVEVRLRARGLLARAGALERRLRFYLQR